MNQHTPPAAITAEKVRLGDILKVGGENVTVTRYEPASWPGDDSQVPGIAIWYQGESAAGVLRRERHEILDYVQGSAAPVDAERAKYIDGLRILAAVLEQHPGIPLPRTGDAAEPVRFSFLNGDEPRQVLAAAARAIPCTWRKEATDADERGRWPGYFDLYGQLGGLHLKLRAERDVVCTRRVVGTEDREVDEVVTPAVTRTVVRPVEVVAWECDPLMAPREPAAVPGGQIPAGDNS